MTETNLWIYFVELWNNCRGKSFFLLIFKKNPTISQTNFGQTNTCTCNIYLVVLWMCTFYLYHVNLYFAENLHEWRMDIWLKVFIACVVIQNVQTQSRPVVNTTCLELVKPSNQQYRLICSHDDYHCLLDESYTQEFEVCREWKWIPRGTGDHVSNHCEALVFLLAQWTLFIVNCQ